ncbi:putative PEP-binding protein, partial [Arthrospira platensis SPKY1]|nr:putative PEP-binding protein [Arthrospira platensis SPKY1]
MHEFVPHDNKGQKEMADVMGVDISVIKHKVEDLSEINPMLGHRGCRLGNTYPEITEMQTRAIIEAALNLKKKGIKAIPEIMIPLTGTLEEMKMQEGIVRSTVEEIFSERGDKIDYLVGT